MKTWPYSKDKLRKLYNRLLLLMGYCPPLPNTYFSNIPSQFHGGIPKVLYSTSPVKITLILLQFTYTTCRKVHLNNAAHLAQIHVDMHRKCYVVHDGNSFSNSTLFDFMDLKLQECALLYYSGKPSWGNRHKASFNIRLPFRIQRIVAVKALYVFGRLRHH